MGMKINRVRLLQVKTETTKGTFDDPATGGTSIICINPRYFAEFGTVTRELSSATISTLGSLTTTTPMRFEFGVEASRLLSGATPEAAIAALMPGCATSETIGASDVVYAPISDFAAMKTLSMKLSIDGYEIDIRGAMGTWTLVGNLGELPRFDFVFSGVFEASTPGGSAPTATPPSAGPAAFLNVGFNYGAATPVCVANTSLAANNTVSPNNCANEAGGIEHFFVSDRASEFATDPQLDSDPPDYLQLFKDSTETILTYNVQPLIAVSVPRAVITALSDEENEGKATVGLTHLAAGADDEWSLTYT